MPNDLNDQEVAPIPRAASLPFPLDINLLHSLKLGGFILFGVATLVAGVAVINDRRIQTGSLPIACYQTPAGTTGTNLKAVCAQGTLTITAINTSGSTVTSDTSKVSYFLVI
jgi:hypothetical protein